MRLIIEDLEGSTTVVPLGTDAVTIGRKDHNTIQLTEQNVSRTHAKLAFRDEGWIIEDLGSYNGVKVNGVPIGRPTPLRENDLIQIGDYHLTLTDDVDRATVDIERPRAANDGMGASSMELPSVSVDDLEPMRPYGVVGGVAGGVAGAGMASTGGRALSYQQQPQQVEEEEERSKGGLIISIVLVGLVLLGVGVWAATRGGDDEKPDKASEGTDKQVAADSGAADAGAADAGAADAGAADAGAADAGAADAGAADAGAADAGAADTTDAPIGEEAVEIIDDPVEPVEDKPKPKPGGTTPKPKPQKSGLSPDQALEEARKAMVAGNNSKAYSLAKEAFDGGKGTEALSLMGVTACKMGSSSKAKSAYRKLPESKKEMLEKVCGPLGIDLQ